MKNTILTIICLMNIVTFAQEKEISKAFQLLESNPTESYLLINDIKEQIVNKTNFLKPEIYTKYLYLNGITLLNKGDYENSANEFITLNKYENLPIYLIKDKLTKEKFYTINKDTLNNNYTVIKEVNIQSNLYPKSYLILMDHLRNISTIAYNDYNKKNYGEAAKEFLKAYYLSISLIKPDLSYLYYTALSYHAESNIDKALPIYIELVEKKYTSKDVSEKDIYYLISNILYEKKDYEQAIEWINKALEIDANDQKFNDLLTQLAKNSGDDLLYINQLLKKIEKDPDDFKSIYNLAMVYSKYPEYYDLAKVYLAKVIETEPDFKDAYIGFSSILLQEDVEITNKMMNINDKEELKKLEKERKDLYNKVLPYLEKAFEIDSDDDQLNSILIEIYKRLNNI